ncbi:PREDICTED: phosphatidylinositol 3,4,5-trisphosphate 3-phosphatase TPTE2 [Rhinopithecus bieti]|uniref:phosphatidylinositol 3,4,5-trisphosphate 3-phosphatase TPTE2 n=1 Tax=Rhinopithecus bieti TaxID=61621 RepID=UPI00083C6A5A|nr:PREDICTED: phosphatidylinositol 3,4,5-trisphosphate 3-phosphatase TPTE2 [Rhinopithecus bieti]
MCRVMKVSFSRRVNLELCLLSDCVLLTSSSPPTNELSGTNLEARINESAHPNALVGIVIERSPSDSTQTNEFKGATEETLTNETPHSSECKGAALLSPISKR